MNPLVILGGLVGAGWGAVKLLRKPAQVQTVIGAGGVPVRIITPATSITPGQASGISAPASPSPTHTAVAHVGPAGVAYAPPKSIVTMPSGAVQPPPIIQTPTGSSSVAIISLRDVQHALNALGYSPPLKEDGILGPRTIANVRAFQGKSSLAVDGNAGPATKAALSSALVALASGGSPIAKPGAVPTPQNPKPQYDDNWAAPKTAPTAADTSAASSMSLRDIQRALNLLGTSPKLAEDGKSGASTAAAIKSFQLAHGLAADGIAGPKTKAVLYQLEHAPVKQFTGEGQFSGRFC